MSTYRYEAGYTSGERVNGIVEAVSRQDAVAKIRTNCDIVYTLKEIPKVIDGNPLDRFHRIKDKSLAMTCSQFAIILKSGLSLVQTVDLAAGQTDDKELAKLLRQVSEDIANGWSLSYSLDQRGEKLPVTFKESIRAGEASGDLVSAFDRMAKYYDRTSKTKSKTASAMTYPAFVVVVGIIVLIVIMGYAVPQFIDVFGSLDIELPIATQILIAVSGFVNRNILYILLLLAAAGLAVWIYSRTETGRLNLSRMRLHLPVLGKIGLMAGASQFAHTMSAMLAAGMPILQAIEVSGKAITSRILTKEVLDTIEGVESGRTLGDSMRFAQELPPMLVEMTSVGEAAGALESTLEVLAEYYDNEVNMRTEQALALLEPIIICVLAVFVVFILFAVYLPMFSLYGSI